MTDDTRNCDEVATYLESRYPRAHRDNRDVRRVMLLARRSKSWPDPVALLSMVLSLYLRSTLGIIFFQSLDKFGGAFEEPSSHGQDAADAALVVDQHRSLPALRQLALALRSRCDEWIIAARPPSLYRIWKIRALCWVLRRLRAGQRGWRDEGGIQISP